MKWPLLIAGFLLVFSSCETEEQYPIAGTSFTQDKDFNAYWFRGKAEVNTYRLKQARYGEMRDGYTALIFVTEDYSLSRHLKVNKPEKAGDDKISILKLNTDKKFNTGIYQYAMMQSVFTPVNLEEHPHSLRATTSSQEWCGHSFSLLDLQKGKYAISLHSYFESEGDRKWSVKLALLEDEIWTRLRIAPGSLPEGEVDVIPGAIAARFSHRPQAVEKAEANWEKSEIEWTYRLRYNTFTRSLSIRIEPDFPHRILGWEETYISGSGDEAMEMTSIATLHDSLFTPYWKQHTNEDEYLRGELGLEW